MRKSRTKTGGRLLAAGVSAALATAAALVGTATPALAGATLTLSTSQVAIAGGTVLYITGGTALADDMGVRFALSSNSCPADYDTAQTGTVDGGEIEAIDTGTAYVTTPALPSGTYKPCLYAGDAVDDAAYATDTLAASGTVTVTAVNFGTLSPTTGKATDKVTVTASSAIYTGTTYTTQFVSGVSACPTTYTTVSATVLAATTVKTSTSVLTATVPTVTTGTAYYVCNYVGSTAGTSALASRGDVTFTSYATTLPTVTLNPTGGSSATATTVTVTAASALFTGTPDTLLTRNTCPTTYAAGSNSLEPYDATTTKISTSKVAVTMPTTVIVGGSDVTTQWKLCVYASSSSGALLAAPATYTVAPVLSVDNVEFAVGSGAAAATGSGPAQGGSSITISGLTGIPTAEGAVLSASLGGSEITNIAAIDSTSFSGTTTAHAPGVVNLTVTTAAGSKSTSDTPYTYTYGITVSPNTAASGATPVLDITGAGFSTLTFGDVTDGTILAASTAYVLLTNNAWNSQTFNGIVAIDDTDANEPVSYCNGVLPISDEEIICTLALDTTFDDITVDNTPETQAVDVAEGTYTITVVNTRTALDSDDHNFSIVSSGSTFTVAPY